MKTTIRSLIKVVITVCAAAIVTGIASCSSWEGEMSFTSPVDGDMLTEYDGIITNGCLKTTVKISAPGGASIKVNGIKTLYKDNNYQADILLTGYRNVIEITERKSGQKQSMTVYWLKNYINKYRLSLDDNIWFLKDISENSLKYNSIFENPYLGFLKEVHDTYGTKIHINIYYQTDGFNLSQMTDKYKSEWIRNSNWLRLSFHALGNDPDKPYINAGYEQVKKDCDMVQEQIERFAGKELLGPVTTLHWGEATVEGCRALKDSGYTALAGYFNIENGIPVVSYYLDNDQIKHLSDRYIWCDNREGIIYKKIAIVINSYDLKQIVPLLDELKKDPRKSGFIDLMIHEQYFYPHYVDYQSDYRQKVMTSVKWAVDNGYQPAFLSDCIFN